MSFSVKAGGSPSQMAAQPASAAGQVYVSPSLLPQSAFRNPPSFSLSDRGEEAPSNTSKRVGTDPTKYKTTMCRNWEQNGSCSFRGCTFAHGVDELRPPTRHNTSPPLPPQQSPPLYASSNVVPPNQSSVSPPGTYKIEQLLEMLMGEVNRERDLVSVLNEANKNLEGLLRKEQAVTLDAKQRVEALQKEATDLSRKVGERNSMILKLLEKAGDRIPQDLAKRADALVCWGSKETLEITQQKSGAAQSMGPKVPAPKSQQQQQQQLPQYDDPSLRKQSARTPPDEVGPSEALEKDAAYVRNLLEQLKDTSS